VPEIPTLVVRMPEGMLKSEISRLCNCNTDDKLRFRKSLGFARIVAKADLWFKIMAASWADFPGAFLASFIRLSVSKRVYVLPSIFDDFHDSSITNLSSSRRLGLLGNGLYVLSSSCDSSGVNKLCNCVKTSGLNCFWMFGRWSGSSSK